MATRSSSRAGSAAKGDPAVDTLVARYPPAVQAVAAGARRLIRRLLPRVDETADASGGLIGYGYGPGYKGSVCTLILGKSGVKVGLVRGAELDDPLGLLAGAGKVHRHIQLKTPADLERPGVSELIAATDAAWRERTET
jgi:hypothetical protein